MTGERSGLGRRAAEGGVADEVGAGPGPDAAHPGCGAEHAEQLDRATRGWAGRAHRDQPVHHRTQAAAGIEPVDEFADAVGHADLVEEAGEHLAGDQVEHLAAERECGVGVEWRDQLAMEFGEAVQARLESELRRPVDQQPAQMGIGHLGGKRALGGNPGVSVRRRLAERHRAGLLDCAGVGARTVAGVRAQVGGGRGGRHADDLRAHPRQRGNMHLDLGDAAALARGGDADGVVAGRGLCVHRRCLSWSCCWQEDTPCCSPGWGLGAAGAARRGLCCAPWRMSRTGFS